MTTTTHAHTSDNRTFDPASEAALAQLVDAYQGDATVTLLDLAHYCAIAVAYLDRNALEARIGRTFSDAEWQQVAEHLDSYDEWLNNSGAAESIDYWISDMLLRQAGITPDL